MEFVCYLALSMYFIEIIVPIMFHKKKSCISVRTLLERKCAYTVNFGTELKKTIV